MKYHKPKVIFLENVKNLKAHNGGATFQIIEKTLTDLNYTLYYKVLNAKNFGLPQNRERIAIVCIRKDIDNKKFEKPKSKEEGFENIKKMSGKVNYAVTGVTIKDLYQDKEISFTDTTEVFFKNVTDNDISWYVENEKYLYYWRDNGGW